MPAFPRSHYVLEDEIATYHAWSRCVQRAFLCGQDPLTGQNYDHRRDWIEQLFEYQAAIFAIDLGNYNILSNHEHLLVRTRPDIVQTWSDEEVAWRWRSAWPHWNFQLKKWEASPTDESIRQLLAEPEHLAKVRQNLASLSWFMARVKEPIAKLANQEMQRTGHYWEQRYKCRRLEDAPAVLIGSVYIDLNQLAAGMAPSLDESRCSAIRRRLVEYRREQAQLSLEEFHTADRPDLKLELEDVIQLLSCNFLAPISNHGPLLLVGDMERNIVVPSNANDEPMIVPPAPAAAGELSVEELHAAARTDTSAETELSAAAREIVAGSPVQQAPANKQRRRFSRDERAAAPPTYEIHHGFKAAQKPRASDHAIIGLPLEQYIELVCCTAARLYGATPTSDALPQSVASLLSEMGIVVESWQANVSGFERIFPSVVGSAPQVQKFLDRAGRKLAHGIRSCRSAFT